MPIAKLKEDLIKKLSYLQKNDIALINRAIDYAGTIHQDQIRLSGHPHITHPLQVAIKIAELKMDVNAVGASLLHDTVEDTDIDIRDIKKHFGSKIASLVDGVTKLNKIKVSKVWFLPFKKNYRQLDRYENQLETLRKMFVAMSKDMRVIIIKICDRINNLKTLKYLPEIRRKRIAKETIDVYAPIANRLGMGGFRDELEDLSFPHLMPKEYEFVRNLAIAEIATRAKYLKKLTKKINFILTSNGLSSFITHRAKRWYSLYIKLLKHNNDISKIYDLVALRIIVPNVQDCYNALGIIHSMWKPLPGRIKDYIALPKPNGYQSIHTTVFAEGGVITEIQIRTPEMHRQAEFGIAAHWHYSQKRISTNLPKRQLIWVNELAKWQSKIRSANDLEQALKLDFFKDRIFTLTPKGEVIDLPNGATPIDFAYAIHTAIGNMCTGSKINGIIKPLSTNLQNGDIVEIIKGRKATPKIDWLKFVKTEHARGSISKFVKKSRGK